MATTTRKIFSCIEALSRAPSGLTISELAATAGLSWQATSRLLESLAADSLVLKDSSSKRYRMSLRFCEWSGAILQSSTSITIARKDFIKLAMETGRQCNFLVVEDLYAVLVERCEVVDGVPVSRFVAARRPWYETANGRAFAAFSSDCRRITLLDETYLRPGLNPPVRDDLERHLDAVREQGYALSPGNTRGIAVPVLDHTGFALATIGSLIERDELGTDSESQLVKLMRATAFRISHYLGFEEPISAEVS